MIDVSARHPRMQEIIRANREAAKAISAVRRLLRLELMADISPAAVAGIAAMRGEQVAR